MGINGMETGVEIDVAVAETAGLGFRPGAVRRPVLPIRKPITRDAPSAEPIGAADESRTPDNRRAVVLTRCSNCGDVSSVPVAAITPTLAHKHLLSSLLCLWTLLIGTGCVILLAGQVSTACLTLFGLTTHAPVQPASIISDVALPQFRLTIKPVYREYPFIADLLLAFPFVLSLLSGMAAVSIFRHWKWWAFGLLTILQPLISMSIVYGLWRLIASELIGWAATIVARHAVAQVVGCLLGMAIGRLALRPLVHIVLPPRFHNLFVYL